jgi:hydroxymethylpyrimidine pyrophosphatase-like HAD family hydrolase
MAAVFQHKLLLALDVDLTLLSYERSLEGDTLSVVTQLLGSECVLLAIVTGNDYVKRQVERVVEPIPADLRRNMIVYADGCTRKMVFGRDGQEQFDECYHQQVAFDQEDKRRVIEALEDRISTWCQGHPDSSIPGVQVKPVEGGVRVAVGPLREDSDVPAGRRRQLSERIVSQLDEACTEVEPIPSDLIWVRVNCHRLHEGFATDDVRRRVERLVPDFKDLATPIVIDRGEQLAVKPVKPWLRPKVTQEIQEMVAGAERITEHEYSALIGGRVTIDIQRAGIDKAFAIRDLQRTVAPHGEILYLGDAFGPNGNDRPVASVAGVTCLNVGPTSAAPEGVLNLGGGPEATLIFLRGLLWALTGTAD